MTEQKLKPAAAGQVERPVRPPVRALRLTLQIGADSRRDMVGALLNFARRIDREELSGSGTWGGCSDGGNWELLTDPNQTHEKFFAELLAYLDALKQPPPVVCGNCDTALPDGCGGLFKDDGKHCRLNAA